MVLRPLVPTMLAVSPVPVTPGSLPTWPGWDAGISMSVVREAACVDQTLIVGTCTVPTTAPAG